MSRKLSNFFSVALFTVLFLTANSINAQQTGAYRVADTQVQNLLVRIETQTDSFKRAIDRALDRSTINNTNTEDSISSYITEFENATDRLRQRFEARRSVGTDVEDVLNRAAYINDFVQRNRLTAAAQREWGNLRLDLNTLAQYYRVNWDWANPVRPIGSGGTGIVNNTGQTFRVSEANVRSLLTRLESRSDIYRRQLNTALDRSVLNDTRSENTLIAYVTDFENAIDALKQKFDARRSVSTDVEEVLNRGYFIDSFMRDYRLTPAAVRQWSLIRTDLDTLATYYNVSWNWNNRQYSPASEFESRLTGTYRLNPNQSDDVNIIVNRALSTSVTRDRQRTNLIRRLTPPQTLVIETRNREVTIASDNAPQVTFNADGVARTETNPNGRTVRITATTNYNGVNLSYEGDRMNDFYVNFMPIGNGQLRVVRRLYIEGRNETVTVASVYDKVNNMAQWSAVNSPSTGQYYPNNTTSRTISNEFIVPNNTRLVAVLNTPLSTKTSVDRDRFTMEVRSPSQYDGAIIEGFVSRPERSGRVTGRAEMTLGFDTIRLPNGQTYRFSGLLNSVRAANGDNLRINNEGAVRDSNQTTRTTTRAGIGAALGALIGAIAGGGQGAVVGAVVGAGAGAGTVVLQGRDDLELQAGTEFDITSSAPSNLGNNR